MTANKATTGETEPRYRIGGVCRLTGLSPHVLRVWERRYGVVTPHRQSNQRRLYSDRDVRKLRLLKQLVDQGQAIGSIAELSVEELEERLNHTGALLATPAQQEPLRVILLGENLNNLALEAGSAIFEVSGRYRDEKEALASETSGEIDALVIERPLLYAEAAEHINQLAERLNARHIVIVYEFASRATVDALTGSRFTPMRAPVDAPLLEAIISKRFSVLPVARSQMRDIDKVAAARRFSDGDLAYLAAQPNAVACECPRHLAQLVAQLAHFESYSAQCQSRSREDAALHKYLHAVTARAREDMEEALSKVIEAEGIRLGDDRD